MAKGQAKLKKFLISLSFDAATDNDELDVNVCLSVAQSDGIELFKLEYAMDNDDDDELITFNHHFHLLCRETNQTTFSLKCPLFCRCDD